MNVEVLDLATPELRRIAAQLAARAADAGGWAACIASQQFLHKLRENGVSVESACIFFRYVILMMLSKV
jgi:hypothetical protein